MMRVEHDIVDDIRHVQKMRQERLPKKILNWLYRKKEGEEKDHEVGEKIQMMRCRNQKTTHVKINSNLIER